MVLSPFCIFILNYELGEHIVLRGPTPYSLPFCILLFWGHIEYYPGLLPTSDEQAVLTINKTTDSTLTMKFRGTDKACSGSIPFHVRIIFTTQLNNKPSETEEVAAQINQ